MIDQGIERRDVLYALSTNNRIPGYIGDLRAQIGAAQLATQRLGEVIDRYGAVTVEESVDSMIDYAAKRFREEVTAWEDGVYEGDAYVDHDPLGNPDVHLHVKITVEGDSLTIDFTGSDTRQELQAWSTYGNTRGYTIGQIAAMMDPEIPKNEGFFDQIKLVVPQGCVLNPHPGRPVSAGTHHPGADVGEVIAVAMQDVLPDKAVPQTYKTGIPTIIVGVDPRTGETFTDHSAEVYAGWCNAAKGMDAWGAQAASFGNLWKATAEINESLFPHVQWGRDYRTDSGGAGQWRGSVRQPLRERGARRREGLHVRRRDEVPDARNPGRPLGRAERDDHPVRVRRPVQGEAHRRLGADHRRSASAVRLRRGRRLG